jgi:polyisoprenoid-binding protein YceI
MKEKQIMIPVQMTRSSSRRRLVGLSMLVASGIILAACGTQAPTAAAPTAPSVATEPAAAPATGDSTATMEAPAAPAADAQVYRIDPAQSEARYEVDETFFAGNRIATAIGRTSGVSGDITIDFAQPANSRIGQIEIDVSQLTSDENRRDNFLRNMGGLVSSQYPQVTFTPTAIEGLPATATVGDQFDITITGNLTVKEATRPVTWEATIKVEDGKISGTASTEVLMSDFGIGPVQMAMLSTEDEVKLYLDFVANAA